MSALAPHQVPYVPQVGPVRWFFGWLVAIAAFAFYAGSILVINAIQMASLLVRPFSMRLFRLINRTVADWWWGWCVLGAEKIGGTTPVFTGDAIPDRENALVFANHQQMPDILVIMMLAWRKRRLGDMKWFVKDPIKYVPGIGWGMQFLDCLFVKRDWLSDRHRIRATFEKFLSAKIPIWLVTFVEGTRLTEKKLERSRKYAARKKLPDLKHVMSPRTRGFTAALEGLEGHLDAVYDVTIGYVGGIPRLHHFYRTTGPKVHVDVRRFTVSSLPQTEPERAQWLHQRFVRKDQLLAGLFKAGAFPDLP